jgi:hypothetical protein
LNEETKVLLGQFALELLGDERFKTFQTLYGQQMAYDILHTLPHEAKKRESIHASYVGYGEFTTVLQNFADYYEQKYKQPTQAAEQDIED